MDTLLTGHQVLLRAGSLRLLLPQAEVGAAEYRECEAQPTAQRGLFTSSFGGTERHIVYPSDRLRPQARIDGQRFVLVQLRAAAAGELWFAWDEVRVFINPAFSAIPLPAAFDAPAMPLTHYVELQEDVLLCGHADEVAAHLCEGLVQ